MPSNSGKVRLPALRPDTNECASPQLVLLGAGASRAACPSGDANGQPLPLMMDLVTTVGLDRILAPSGIDSAATANFESLYESLVADPTRQGLVREIEGRLLEYFRALAIPSRATLYDRLVLSLRPKDYIATFNWDPLLAQAYKRNRHLRELPQLLFLHGNVGVGVCVRDERKGFADQPCSECGRPLEPTRLLYPVGQKNYTSDPFIAQEWIAFRSVLENAYLFTIIGYAAPVSDVEAVTAMRSSWGANPTRELAQIDIIDIKSETELRSTWAPFFVRDHYGFWDSPTPLFNHARRSCDHFAMASLQLHPCRDTPLPDTDSLDDLQRWAARMIESEVALRDHGVLRPC